MVNRVPSVDFFDDVTVILKMTNVISQRDIKKQTGM